METLPFKTPSALPTSPSEPVPPASKPAPTRLRFGPWTFEHSLHRLQGDGKTVRLEPKLSSLLLFLLQRPKQVVSKDDLVAGVWQHAHIADSALTRAIAELRRALGDDARQPRFIETIPKSGYRWLLVPQSLEPARTATDDVVSPAESAATRLVDATHSEATPRLTSLPNARNRLWNKITLTLAAVALLGLIVYRAADQSVTPPLAAAIAEEKLIAVMPLTNLSNDPEQDYFAEGMTEALVTYLAQNGAVGVISRHSIDSLIEEGKEVDEIIKRLSLDALIDGSVAHEDDQVRISLRMLETGKDTYTWAQSYERRSSDALALQSEVSQAVAEEIDAALGSKHRARTNLASTSHGPNHRQSAGTGTVKVSNHEVDPQAYVLYMKGLGQAKRSSRKGPNQAAELLEKAIALEPDYAPAYAALAEYYGNLLVNRHTTSPQIRTKARDAAQRAIALDETLARPHAILATLSMLYDWQFESAERSFQRAIQLNPSHAIARKEYAYFLTIAGRFREATEQVEKATQLDPLEPEVRYSKAHVYLHAGRYEDALAAVRMATAALGKPAKAHPYSAWALALMGRFEEALAEFEQLAVHRTSGSSSLVLGSYGWVLAQAGQRSAAEGIRQRLTSLISRGEADPFSLALVESGLGNLDAAIDALELALKWKSRYMLYIGVEPFLRQLTNEPRFRALLSQLGLDEISVPNPRLKLDRSLLGQQALDSTAS